MAEIARNYVTKAIESGRRTERRYANGLDYIFIFEEDGWISIVDVTGGEYNLVIQSKDIEHAESYITFIEPIPPYVRFI